VGFDRLFNLLDQAGGVDSASTYPPYNIERTGENAYRVTLAVAGFTLDQLEVAVEQKELLIRGRQQDDKSRQYLHRGIAARQFQRTFVLADGMEVMGADLRNGLLSIDLARPEPARVIRTVSIKETE